MILFRSLIKKIRSRSMVTAICVYLGGAWVVIQVVGLFVDIYNIPNQYFNFVIVMFMGGIPMTLTFSWFHGEKGRQAFQMKEVILHTIIVAVTITMGIYFSRKSFEIPASHPLKEKSIAVLPFTNMSDEPSNEYFSDGMTDDILTHLARINDLMVISRTSVMKYKNSTKSIKEIAGELNVTTILEGSVRKNGNNLRITAQLINAKTDTHMWANNFDRQLTDIFKIQSEIAQIIAAKLKIKLLDNSDLLHRKPTKNIAAYNLFLKGKSNFYRFNREGNKNAKMYFKKAIEFDEKFADAWAFLAISHMMNPYFFKSPDNHMKKAFDAVHMAMTLSPNSEIVHTVLGYLYSEEARNKGINYHKKAMESFEYALHINPNFIDATIGLAIQYTKMGIYDKAISMLNFAYERDPTHMIISNHIMLSYLEMGQLDYAYHFGKKAFSVSPNYRLAGDLALVASFLEEKRVTKRWIGQTKILNPDLHSLAFFEIRVALFNQLHTFNKDKIFEMAKSFASIPPLNKYFLDIAGHYTSLYDLNQAKSYFNHSIKWNKLVETDHQTLSHIGLGRILLIENKVSEAKKKLLKALQLRKESLMNAQQGYRVLYEIAAIHSILGEKKEALLWFKKSVDNGLIYYHHARIHPWFENIRNEKAFQEALGAIKDRLDMMRKRVEVSGWGI